ncbi:MAG: GC-type dockerin domain-anchored protein, partial [Planctomycetota bacterium]
PTFADGSPAPLPVVRTFAGAPSGNKWIVNTGKGRPAGSEWVIRPEGPLDKIYGFGLTTIGDDLVRIEGFDAEGNLAVSVDSQPIAEGAFTGFVSEVGVRRIVITPTGDGDSEVGIDDLIVSLNPGGLCIADTNCDGLVNFFDVALYIDLFTSGDDRADIHPSGAGDGINNFRDLLLYLDFFRLGCP